MSKKTINIISIIIAGLLLSAMFLIWPLKSLIHVDRTSSSLIRAVNQDTAITSDSDISFQYIPTLTELKKISVLLFNANQAIMTGSVTLSVYDGNGDYIGSSVVTCDTISNGKFSDFIMPLTLHQGETYTCTLTSEGYGDAPVYLSTITPYAAASELISLSINGSSSDVVFPCISFQYSDSPTFEDSLPYYVIICILGILIFMAIQLGIRHKEFKNSLVTPLLIGFSILTVFLTILTSNEGNTPINIGGGDMKRINCSAAYGSLYLDEGMSSAGEMCNSGTFTLKKGTYTFGIEYLSTQEGNSASVTANGQEIASYGLTPNLRYQTFELTLNKDIEEIIVHFNYGAKGTFYINSMDLNAKDGFYNDTFFFAFAFLVLSLICILAFLIYQRKSKCALEFKKLTIPLLLIGIGVVASMPLLSTGLFWGDDIAYHLIRIEGIKDGLRDGQFPVLIYPEGCDGFGYLNAMYPNLFLYIAAFIRLFGVSLSVSYKSLLFLANIGMAVASYGAVRSMKGGKKVALLAAGVYCLCPYHFTNFYARAAVGESLAMVFLPLLIAGLYHVMVGDKKKYYLLVLGISGLLETHILSFLLGVILCVLCGIVFIVPIIREKRFLVILKAAIITVLLNAVFLIPFLYFYLGGNLHTSSLGWSNYFEYSIRFSQLLGTVGDDGYRQLTFGIPIACMLVIILIYLVGKQKENRNEKTFFAFFFVITCVMTYMLVNQFNSKAFMNISIIKALLTNIQFPWRLLGIISCIAAILGAVCLERCESLRTSLNAIVISLIVISAVATATEHSVDTPYESINSTYTDGHVVKVTGVIKGDNTIVYPYEWISHGLSSEIIAKNEITTSSDNIQIIDYNRKGTTTTLTFSCDVAYQNMLLPIAYYKGYTITDENNHAVTCRRSATGQVMIDTPSDGITHTYTIRYQGHFLFTAAFLLSILTGVTCFVYWMFQRRKGRNQ